MGMEASAEVAAAIRMKLRRERLSGLQAIGSEAGVVIGMAPKNEIGEIE
jgi:hypothetical protein